MGKPVSFVSADEIVGHVLKNVRVSCLLHAYELRYRCETKGTICRSVSRVLQDTCMSLDLLGNAFMATGEAGKAGTLT